MTKFCKDCKKYDNPNQCWPAGRQVVDVVTGKTVPGRPKSPYNERAGSPQFGLCGTDAQFFEGA